MHTKKPWALLWRTNLNILLLNLSPDFFIQLPTIKILKNFFLIKISFGPPPGLPSGVPPMEFIFWNDSKSLHYVSLNFIQKQLFPFIV